MHIPGYYEFFNKTRISSGKKALENIPFDLKSMDAVKPLVVTDAWSVKQGYADVLKKSFYDSGMIIGAIYDQVHKYPSTATVMNLVKLYRDRGCDSIIALGGASPAAVAKGLNIVVSNKGDNLLDFTDMSKSAHLRPFVYIPTSDALGTETSCEAVIDARIYRSHDLMPDTAVIDPRMIGRNDAKHIAGAGLLALVQAVEACTYAECNPVNDSFAFAAMGLVFNNFRAAMGGMFKSRERASFVNGVAISGIVYSNAPEGLARAIGFEAEKMTGYPAGICAGMVLPYLLDYKLSGVKAGVRPELLLPLAGIDRYCATEEGRRAGAGVDALYGLLAGLDRVIPANMKLMNIPGYMIEKIAAAAEERTGTLFPKGMALAVLDHAYHGNKFGGGR